MRKTHCAHCGDTGLARFYYDRRNKSHVFLAPEFLSLPAALQWELRCQTALCDCRPGLDHPKRACTTVIHRHGQEQRVPTWPRMETIRTRAAQRQQKDAKTLGAPNDPQERPIRALDAPNALESLADNEHEKGNPREQITVRF